MYGTVNGIMLMVTWFLCRILIFPFMYYAYGKQYGIAWHQVLEAFQHFNLYLKQF